jgi:SH3 and multiple ankyrin repeat domains protein
MFSSHCVQEVRMRQNINSATLRVAGRREKQNEPLRHRTQSPKTVSFNLRPMKKKRILTELFCRVTIRLPAEPRTVVLHRSRKGFGFVLRGAKATSPLMELTPLERCPALQYLDDVDLILAFPLPVCQ